MKVHIVYAHHDPSSLTSTLKNATVSGLSAQGHEVSESDLYGLGFEPVAGKIDFTTPSSEHFNYQQEQKKSVMKNWAFSPDIIGEFEKIKTADMVIFHFPVWWSSVPAILKGWFDRVLIMGGAWDEHGQTFDGGLMRGKQALVVGCCADSQEAYSSEGMYGADMTSMLTPVLNGTLAFCGFDVHAPYIVYGIGSMGDEERTEAVASYRNFLATATTAPVFYSRVKSAPETLTQE